MNAIRDGMQEGPLFQVKLLKAWASHTLQTGVCRSMTKEIQASFVQALEASTLCLRGSALPGGLFRLKILRQEGLDAFHDSMQGKAPVPDNACSSDGCVSADECPPVVAASFVGANEQCGQCLHGTSWSVATENDSTKCLTDSDRPMGPFWSAP